MTALDMALASMEYVHAFPDSLTPTAPSGLVLLTALAMVFVSMGLVGASLGGPVEIAASAHVQTVAMTTELAKMAFAFAILALLAWSVKIAFAQTIVQGMVCALRI